MSPQKVDLFVIGAGSGGVRAARIAAGYGARVAIAEESRYGGTCVIRGCVPKKLMVIASRYGDEIELAKSYGWRFGEVGFDWPSLVAAKEREITRLEGIYKRNLEAAGVTTIDSRATLEGPHTVRIEATGETVHAERILIATGGKPYRPQIPGAEFAISSNEVFDMPALPASIVIEGGGFIATEFGCMLARLGVKVTIVYRGDRILRGFDDDLRDHLSDAMRAAGIDIVTHAEVRSIAHAPAAGAEVLCGTVDEQAAAEAASVTAGQASCYKVALSNGEEVATGLVMLATGRWPHVEGLGLEAAGVETVGRRNAIKVSPDSRTSAPSIWAVGDVTDRLALTPIAIREGHAFADTVFGKRPWVCDHFGVPEAVFSTPEIGTVGMSEAAARAAHSRIDVYRATFRPMASVLSDSPERMLMKLVVDAGSDRVLGVHLCGPDAAEIIQMAAIAVKMGATKRQFDETVALHPTSAEELVTMRTPVR